MLPAWTTTCERMDRRANCTRLWNISFSIFPSNPNLILLLSIDMYLGTWYSCWPIEAEARQRRVLILVIMNLKSNIHCVDNRVMIAKVQEIKYRLFEPYSTQDVTINEI